MKLGIPVDLGPGHIVLGGDPAPPPQRGAGAPQFSVNICCGQMAGWIKMPLGTEVGLGPGEFMLDGDPAALPKKGAEPPIFGPCLLWKNRLVDEDGTWHGGRPHRLSPGNFVFDGDPAPPHKGAEPPNFWPMSIVAKLLDGSIWHLVWR